AYRPWSLRFPYATLFRADPDRFFGAATDREGWIIYNVYGLLSECNAPVSYAFECNRVDSLTARDHSKYALYHLYHLLSSFGITLDRKSTRLNSSHVNTSY